MRTFIYFLFPTIKSTTWQVSLLKIVDFILGGWMMVIYIFIVMDIYTVYTLHFNIVLYV